MLDSIIATLTAIASTTIIATLAYFMRQRSEAIDKRLAELADTVDAIEDKLDASIRRIHERVDAVVEKHAELEGYVRGLKNGGR